MHIKLRETADGEEPLCVVAGVSASERRKKKMRTEDEKARLGRS